jgi:ribosomal protein L7Ae-like RNA K-turn-binding protein
LEHKARLLLLASDAGESTAQRLRRMGNDKLPVVTLPEDKTALGGALGFAGVAAVALCDLGFAAAVAEKLAAADAQYEGAFQVLSQRRDKAQRRKADTAKNGRKKQRKQS